MSATPKRFSYDTSSRLPYPPDPWTCEHGYSCERGRFACPDPQCPNHQSPDQTTTTNEGEQPS